LKPLVVCQSVTPKQVVSEFILPVGSKFFFMKVNMKKKETLPALVASGEQDFDSDWNGGQ